MCYAINTFLNPEFDSKIVLINGDELAQFMIAHNVGVSTVKTYEIKRVDSDYFAVETTEIKSEILFRDVIQ